MKFSSKNLIYFISLDQFIVSQNLMRNQIGDIL